MESWQDWKGIFDTLTDMITVHDRDFNIIHYNKAAEKILGLPAINHQKAKCFKYYHGREQPPEGCPSCRCMQTGKPDTFELFEPHLNMFIEIRAIPRFDVSGRLIGLIHIVRDITARKQVEDELEIHRDHLEWLVNDRTAKITAANEKLLKKVAERNQAEEEKEALIEELQTALANIKTLSGLLPICAWCKKIRRDSGYWQQIEAFVSEHSQAEFTHAICPDCAQQLHKDDDEHPAPEKAA